MVESDIDKFLREFDKRPEAHSDNRRREEEKYKRIFRLRDEIEPKEDQTDIWKDF